MMDLICFRASVDGRLPPLSPCFYGIVGQSSLAITARDLRGRRDFVTERKARLGLVIANDSAPRQYEEDLPGLPFNWL